MRECRQNRPDRPNVESVDRGRSILWKSWIRRSRKAERDLIEKIRLNGDKEEHYSVECAGPCRLNRQDRRDFRIAEPNECQDEKAEAKG